MSDARSWPGSFVWRAGRASRALGLAGYASLTGSMLLVTLLRVITSDHGWLELRLAAMATMFLAPALLVVGWVLGRQHAWPGRLAVTADALRVEVRGATRVIPRGEIAGGARDGSGAFELRLRGGNSLSGRLASADSEALRALFAELSLDARHRAVTLGMTASTTPAFRAAWLFFLGLVVTVRVHPAYPDVRRLMILTALTAGAWALAAASRGATVTVGIDGLRVRRWGRERYVAWSDVAGVTASGSLALTLTDGERVRLGSATPRAGMLAARIAEARAAAGEDATVVAALARQGRPLAAWREAVGALTAGGYRDGAVSEGALEGVLRGGTSGDARVGAALALVAADRARHATGVRVAAAALADERVRVALEEIADGEVSDATLRRATR